MVFLSYNFNNENLLVFPCLKEESPHIQIIISKCPQAGLYAKTSATA
jgi:hypothetical protein